MSNEAFHYTVEVRNVFGKLFTDFKGLVVPKFRFTNSEEDESIIQLICERTFRDYQAITGSNNINITVSYHNSIAGVYEGLYSYYGSELKFVKHT